MYDCTWHQTISGRLKSESLTTETWKEKTEFLKVLWRESKFDFSPILRTLLPNSLLDRHPLGYWTNTFISTYSKWKSPPLPALSPKRAPFQLHSLSLAGLPVSIQLPRQSSPTPPLLHFPKCTGPPDLSHSNSQEILSMSTPLLP